MLILSSCDFAIGVLSFLYSFCGAPVEVILIWAIPLCIIGVLIPDIGILIENPNSRTWSFYLKGIYKSLPNWAAPCHWLLLIIAIINYILFGIHNGWGLPDVRNGQFVIVDHGLILKILTRQDYDIAKRMELRTLAVWVVFACFGPMMYWFFHQKDTNQAARDHSCPK
jgi:hypothetical protein